MSKQRGVGGVEVSFEYRRHVGPRFIHGGVTLQFDGHLPYRFVSTAKWPGSDSYEPAIRETIEEVLRERQGNLGTTQVTLKHISWDEMNSCEVGFRRATLVAARAAFEI